MEAEDSDLSDLDSDYEPSTDDSESDHLSEVSDGSNDTSDSDDDVAQPQRRGRQPNQPNRAYVSKNGNEHWEREPIAGRGRQQFQNIVRERPGPTAYANQRVGNLEDTFDLFFRPAIVDEIIAMSNLEGRRVYGNNWNDLDVVEFRRYLGTLILIGVYRGKNEPVTQLWSRESGREVIRKSLPRDRFKQLSRVLRFDDAQTRRRRRNREDKLAPIRRVSEEFVHTLKDAFKPSECLTVDEQLVTFRGRCPFRQYIPSKPGKYGIKIWALCDSRTSYALNLQVYTGRQAGNAREVNQGQRVVLDMVEGFQNSGRNVTTDNFFTSLALANALLAKKLSLVGTVRKNRGELPTTFTTTKGREEYSSLFGFQPQVTITSYCPKKGKVVVLMSSMHHDNHVSDLEHIIMDYNSTKGGVDTLDQLARTYSVKRMTRRWPMAVFYDMVDIAGVNAFIIWTAINPNYHTGKNHRRRIFLEELGTALVRVQHVNPVPGPAAVAQNEPAQVGKRSRCYLCPREHDRKYQIKCTRCDKFICKEHSGVICRECA